MGGMAAQIPIKNDAKANEAALTKVLDSKLHGAPGPCFLVPKKWHSVSTYTSDAKESLQGENGLIGKEKSNKSAESLHRWLQVRADKTREVKDGHDGT